MNRRGFSLVEILIATAILAIVGTALTRMLLNNSRYVSRLDAMMNARQASRAAMHTMAVEVRMVSNGGLTAATPTSVLLQVPYAWGMTCNMSGTDRIASLVPADSMTYASATADGLAWRDAAGAYNSVTGITVAGASDETPCDAADSVRVVPGGLLIAISGASAVPSESIFYLYQTIQYTFAASSELPGRIGLWRQAGAGPNEELLAPFDSTAAFRFLVGSDLAVQDSAPADLSTVRGLQLKLIGASEATPQGSDKPQVFDLRSTVLFLNSL